MSLSRLFSALFACSLVSALGGCGGGSPPQTAPTANTTPIETSTQSATTSVSPEPTLPHGSTQPIIRVLALYSEQAAQLFPTPVDRITHLLNVANETLAFSAVTLSFELAQVLAVDYPDELPITSALADLTSGTGQGLENVSAWRDAHEADLVVLFRPYVNDGLCGYAWLGGYRTNGDFSNPREADFGYSVVAIDCSDYMLLHELGHNLGLAHSRREAPLGGSFPHGAGYGINNDFVTIMATPGEFNAPQLPLIASPRLACNASPCGIAATDPSNGADAVAALNAVVDQVATYR